MFKHLSKLASLSTVVNSGIKGFAKNAKNSACEVQQRACQESIHLLVRSMTKRKVFAGFSDFRKCLGCSANATELEEFTENFAAQVKVLDSGSFAVILKSHEKEHMMAAMWKCKGDAVDGLIGKPEVASMLKKLSVLEENDTKGVQTDHPC